MANLRARIEDLVAGDDYDYTATVPACRLGRRLSRHGATHVARAFGRQRLLGTCRTTIIANALPIGARWCTIPLCPRQRRKRRHGTI